jgi:tetratricopeptide (TPR) repeat protein
VKLIFQRDFIFLLSILLGFLATDVIANEGFTPELLQQEIKKTCENGPARKPNYGRVASKQMIDTGWQMVGKGEGLEAAKLFLTALFIGPENHNAYWGLAIASHVAKFPLEMINACFERARLRFPNVSDIYSDHGRILEERNHSDEAIVAFKKALEIDGNNLNAHIGLTRSYGKIGEAEKFEFHKRRVLELQKRNK